MSTNIGAHRLILAIHSKMFYALFKMPNIFTDPSTTIYQFDEDVGVEAIVKFRDFTYFGKCEVDMNTFKELLIFVDRFDCTQLLQTLRHFMMNNTDDLITWCVNVFKQDKQLNNSSLYKIISLMNSIMSFNDDALINNIFDKMISTFKHTLPIPGIFECDLFLTYIARLRNNNAVYSEDHYLYMVQQRLLRNQEIDPEIVHKMLSCLNIDLLTPKNRKIFSYLLKECQTGQIYEPSVLKSMTTDHNNWGFFPNEISHRELSPFATYRYGISNLLIPPQSTSFSWIFEIVTKSTQYLYHNLAIRLFTIPNEEYEKLIGKKVIKNGKWWFDIPHTAPIVKKYSERYRCYSIVKHGYLESPNTAIVDDETIFYTKFRTSDHPYSPCHPKYLRNGDIFTITATWNDDETMIKLTYNEYALGKLDFHIPSNSALMLKYECAPEVSFRVH